MKKLYALCLLTLAAVLLDIFLLHSGSASAQADSIVRINRVRWDHNTDPTFATLPTLGRIVGFHCIGGKDTVSECFVASSR